jgi:hypothetical protein
VGLHWGGRHWGGRQIAPVPLIELCQKNNQMQNPTVTKKEQFIE